MSRPKILSVGQCGFDHASIARRLDDLCGAETVAAHSARSAAEKVRAGGVDLVLVNRVFDADGGSGIDLIRTLKGDAATAETPVMLVSNFEASQAEAVRLGALPGFGKSDLSSHATAEKILGVVAPFEVKPA